MGKMKEILNEALEMAKVDENEAAKILQEKLGYKREYAYHILDIYMEQSFGSVSHE